MIGIVYIVERGLLEQQAVLLQKSIEKYVTKGENIISFACCVREHHQPSAKTISLLKKHGANYKFKNLNQKHNFFPLCNGIYATSSIEQSYNDLSGLLLVDTDTVFINPINFQPFKEAEVVARPVDNKGIGSLGENDANDAFWQKAFGLFEELPPPANMITTVDQLKIRPYFNSGFVYAQKTTGFFNEWLSDFGRLMDSDVRTCKDVSRHRVDYGFLEQMSISITLHRMGIRLFIPKCYYNYPLPFRPKLRLKNKEEVSFDDLVHIHYHKWFQHPGFLDHVTSDEEKQSEQYRWLKAQLPLLPEISGPFKC